MHAELIKYNIILFLKEYSKRIFLKKYSYVLIFSFYYLILLLFHSPLSLLMVLLSLLPECWDEQVCFSTLGPAFIFLSDFCIIVRLLHCVLSHNLLFFQYIELPQLLLDNKSDYPVSSSRVVLLLLLLFGPWPFIVDVKHSIFEKSFWNLSMSCYFS